MTLIGNVLAEDFLVIRRLGILTSREFSEADKRDKMLLEWKKTMSQDVTS